MAKPTIIFHPTPMIYEAYYINQQPELPLPFPNLDSYCLCDLQPKEEQKFKAIEEPSLSSSPSNTKRSKLKNRNKIIFKPLIIERSDEALKKLQDEVDKD